MGHPDSTTAPSNVIHLADFRVPSYRRRTRDATPTGNAWAAMARQRASAHEQAAAAPDQPSAGVRVTHFPEAANGGDAARLRISGRLADVCAELDRLAEAEARASMRRA